MYLLVQWNVEKLGKMLNELERQSITGKILKIFKPTIDNRFGNNIVQTRSGKKFFISGLNLTAEKKPFGKMGDLMCIADNVELMTSVCEICKNDNAIFSFFKGNKSGDIYIGDSEYIPVCRTCYNKLKNC